MAVKNYAIRLGVEGEAQVKSAWSSTGDAAVQAMGRAGEAADQAATRATAAAERQLARWRALNGAEQARITAGDAQAGYNQVLGVGAAPANSARDSAAVFQAQAAEEDRAAAAAAALRAEINPLAAAQDKLAVATRTADELLARGTITTAEHAAAVASAAGRYEAAAAAVETAAQRQARAWQAEAAAARQAETASVHQGNFNAMLGVGQESDATAAMRAFYQAEEQAADRAAKLRAEINPLIAAQEKLAAATRNADDLLERGAITQAEHAQAVGRAQSRYEAVAGPSPEALASREAASEEERNAAAAARLRAEINPLAAAQEKLAAATREANGLLARGTITEQEHGAAVALATRRYAEAEVGLRHMAHGAGAAGASLNRMQMMEMAHSGRAFVDMLIAGAPPMQALAMEGPRLAQALGSGQGGIAGGLQAVSNGLKSVTGLSLGMLGAIAGVAVAVGVVVKATLDYEASERKLAVAAEYMGASAGASVDRLNAIADAAVKSGQASVGAARDMEVAFLQTGKIGVEQFAGLISVERDFAAATGKDAKEAIKDLATSFANPAKGAEELTAKLHFLSAAELEVIKDMADSGDRAGAQARLLDDLERATAGAAAQTDGLSAKLRVVTDWFGEAWRAAGRYFDRLAGGGTTAERIADLEHKRAGMTAPGSPISGLVSWINQGDIAAADMELKQLRTKLAIDTKKAEERTRDAARNDRSIELRGLADAGSPKHTRAQELGDKRDQLQAVRNDPDMLRRMGLSQSEVDASIKGYDNQIAKLQKVAGAHHHAAAAGDKHAESLARQAASMEVNAAGQLALADAYLKGDDAALLAEAHRKAATDATKKGIGIDAEMRRQLALNVSEQAAAGAKRFAALRDQTEGQKAVNDAIDAGTLSVDDANRALSEEQALRPLLALATLAHAQGLTKEEAAIRRVIAALKEETTESERQKAHFAALQTVANDDDRIDQLRLEIKYAGDLTGQLQRQLAVRKANNDADKGNFSPGDRKKHVDNAVTETNLQIEKTRADYVASAKRSQQDSLEISRAEIALVGKSTDVHDAVIARLKEEQALKAKGVELASAEGQAILANVDAIQRETQRLQQAQAAWSEIKTTGEAIIDKFGEGLSSGTWDGWKQAGLSALKELEQEFLKLALLNPLKNALFGGSAPTLGSVSGIFGSMFGGQSGPAGGIPDDGFLNSVLASLPGYATGTDDAPGGLSWVGENGPELMNVPQGAQVHTHADSLAMAKVPAPANDVRPIHFGAGSIVIQAPDPQAFQASKAQLAAGFMRAARLAQRVS